MRIVGIYPNADVHERYGGTGVCLVDADTEEPLEAFTIRVRSKDPKAPTPRELIETFGRTVAAISLATDGMDVRSLIAAVGLPKDARSTLLAGMFISHYRARVIPRDAQRAVLLERAPGGKLTAPDLLSGRRQGVSRDLSDPGARTRDQEAYIVALAATARGTGS